MFSAGVAVYGSLDRTKSFWPPLVGQLGAASRPCELVVFDNGSPDGYGDWLARFVAPRCAESGVSFCLLRSGENRGVPYAYNRMAEVAQGSVVAYLHNDLYLGDPLWADRVAGVFERYPSTGVVGFHGARGLGADGGRSECWSNLLEAEVHGSRGGGLLPVAVLDGMALVCRREMLDAIGGFDESLGPHHFYDKDVCLASIEKGYRNLLSGVPCHHDGGQTSCSPHYGAWAAGRTGTEPGAGDAAVHRRAEERFLAKWRHRLPVFVPDDLNG